MKKVHLLIVFLLLFKFAMPQSSVVDFIKAGKDDASTLFKSYLNPYALALGDGLNTGWYYSAESHKLMGFDFSLSFSAIKVPDADKTFDIDALGLTNLTVSGSNSIAPTVAGANSPGPSLEVHDDNGNTLASFNSPGGVNLDVVPVPMAQLSFGLLPHTDIILRYVPKLEFNNDDDKVKVGLFGIGAKHSFKEWLPFLKRLPFDAAVFAGYSKITAESGLTFGPTDYGANNNVSVTFTPGDDQRLEIETKTLKYGLIVSKKLGILTVFGAIGNSSSKSSIDLLGKYPVVTALSNGDLTITNEDALYDPINIDFDSSNVSLDAGLRLKLAFFSLFASVTKAEYTSFNAGLGLGFR